MGRRRQTLGKYKENESIPVSEFTRKSVDLEWIPDLAEWDRPSVTVGASRSDYLAWQRVHRCKGTPATSMVLAGPHPHLWWPLRRKSSNHENTLGALRLCSDGSRSHNLLSRQWH
ncbi:hypothetical protein C8R44DRAFT_803061 [Mycena epipterygia]|nr:hypothetical protein C8R44DRAFT_803061 [Mycena epipterygia]